MKEGSQKWFLEAIENKLNQSKDRMEKLRNTNKEYFAI